jgi:hypothetical protein
VSAVEDQGCADCSGLSNDLRAGTSDESKAEERMWLDGLEMGAPERERLVWQRFWRIYLERYGELRPSSSEALLPSGRGFLFVGGVNSILIVFLLLLLWFLCRVHYDTCLKYLAAL